MKAGEAVRVMGDIIPAQLWGLRGLLRVLSHDDHRVGRDPLQVGESARTRRGARPEPPNLRPEAHDQYFPGHLRSCEPILPQQEGEVRSEYLLTPVDVCRHANLPAGKSRPPFALSPAVAAVCASLAPGADDHPAV